MMGKFNYYSWVPQMGKHTPESWEVETEEVYLHTGKSELSKWKYQRIAYDKPFPEKGVKVFNIKTWGRAGWNS